MSDPPATSVLMLSFQKLDVYRCAIEFLALTSDVSAEIPAMECAAALDALLVLKSIDAKTHQRGRELLERIVAMLTRLCR